MNRSTGSWRFLMFFVALIIANVSLPSLSAAPIYRWDPSGHDGAGGQGAVAADPFHPGVILSGGDIWGLSRSTDYGREFLPVMVPVAGGSAFISNSDFKTAALKFSKKTSNLAYAAVGDDGNSGGLLKSTDGGQTWAVASRVPQFSGQSSVNGAANHPRSVGNLIALDPSQTNEYIYVGTYKDGIMRSTDQGSTWSAGWTMPGLTLGTSAFIRGIAIDDNNPQIVYAAVYDQDGDGAFESIYKTTSARTTTSMTLVSPAPPFHQAEEMVVVNGVLYVAASGSTSERGLYRYNGSSWTKIYTAETTTVWYSIDGYWNGSSATIYAGSTDTAASEGNSLYRSVIRIDNAQGTPSWHSLTWDPVKLHTNMKMGDANGLVWWHSEGSVAAIIGGNTFVACQTLLDPSDPTHKRLYVCGRAGMWRTDDATVSNGSCTWYACVRHNNSTVDWDVQADPNNGDRVYTIDMDWCFLYSTDGFNTCHTKTTGLSGTKEYCIGIDSTTNPSGVSPVYLGRDTQLFYNPNPATSSWVSTGLNPPGEVQGVGVKYVGGQTVVLAAVRGSGIWRGIKGSGNTWTWGGAPIYTGGNVTKGCDGSNMHWNFSWGGGTSQMVYFTDKDNGVFRSLDAGQTWTKLTGPWTPGDTRFSGSVAVDPTNAANCYVTASNGVFFSSNANAGTPTWTNVKPSGMGEPGTVVCDGQGAAYVSQEFDDASHTPKIYYRAKGDSTWYDIVTGSTGANTFRALYSIANVITVGGGPDYKIYTCSKNNGNCVGTRVAGDTTPPGAVTNLTATPAGDHIHLSWTNPNDADFAGVRTSRSTADYPQDPLGSDGYVWDQGNVSSIDMNVSPGEMTYVSFFPYDEVPNYHTPPTSISSYGCPAAVTNLNAVANGVGNRVDLSWTNPDVGYTGTLIRRKTGSYPTGPTDGTSIYDGSGTSKSDTGLTDGVTYYYAVWAHDNLSNYSPVAQITAVPSDTTAPGPVTGFTATADAAGNKVNLVWTNPTDSDFAGTMIRRKTGSYPTGMADGTQVYSGTDTSTSDTGITDGVVYYYRAFTSDEVPNYNSNSSQQDNCAPADSTAPGLVSSFTATPGNGQNVLTWTNPTDSDFAGVRIRYSTTGYLTDPGGMASVSIMEQEPPSRTQA